MPEMTNKERREAIAEVNKAGVSPGAALNQLTEDVRFFHLLFGHPAPERPVMQEPWQVERRAKWIESEVVELTQATTLEEQADAYLDIIYFAVGGLVELGLKYTHRLWRFVQAANISKVFPDGSIRKNEVGKVQKPEGWQAPDAAIAHAIADEADPNVATPDQQYSLIAALGDEAVERLSINTGGDCHVLLLAINADGQVASTSNLSLENQRELIRHLNQSLSVGAVLVAHEESKH